MTRLPPGPAEVIDRGRRVSFFLDGRRLEALEGDTVGSAMAAAGIHVFGRSFKYHRPRGLLCMAGTCSNCLVTVDGVPNVRACTEPVREGMRVRRQNAWPSADLDFLRVLDWLSWAMPPGFYYKAFHRPRFLWPRVEPLVRRVAGLGRVPQEVPEERGRRVHLHPDLLVIGGGPSGLSAAIAGARAGLKTVLVEQARQVGGRLLYSTESVAYRGEAVPAYELARRLEEEARGSGVELLSATSALGVFDGPVVAAVGPRALYRIRPRAIVFATGAIEQPAVFGNNDLPGIMLGGAVDRLLHQFRVLPGRRAVVLTLSPEGYRTAGALAEAGAAVTIVDPRPDRGERRDDIVAGSTVLRALGGRRVRWVEVGPPGGPPVRRLPCDLVVVAGAEVGAAGLLAQAGVTLSFDPASGSLLPQALPSGMAIAGRVAGRRTIEASLEEGRLAALDLARALVQGWEPSGQVKGRPWRDGAPDGAAGPPVPEGPDVGGKRFVCTCMDVTTKELEFAVREGFDSMELLKRYTTLSMGPCQGKSCLPSAARLCGRLTGRSGLDVPTARPPWNPVPLGLLAADRLVPRKETSIHDCHGDAGAEFMWAADWRRPHHYSDPAAECRAVHDRVAVIDVSTLGKFRVKGPDAIVFLERLYPGRFGDLKVGRIRYGVMLNDEGVILDDGTVCRLDDDEFFVTTTSGGTEAIERWMTWWLEDWALDVQVLNVTAQYAALNVAGPLSRKLMERLTDLDVSAQGLPYLMSAQGKVAGVPALILRIGFVGELGYEVHFPSAYGQYVWETVLQAGADLGIVPFGVEAQRILRLEKQHILVGQDTDALSDPFGAGMSWVVKLDKPDFLGRRALSRLADLGFPPERLVGFRIQQEVVPPEGSAVVRGGRWVGRVTSSRWSAAAGGVIGMAWVPADLGEDGREFDIRFDGRTVRGTVCLKPFFDPEGARLRS
jgi:sarcosine oxidase subunit alpha